MTPMNNNNYTALVTGATGFIGSHLAERLLLAGYKVKLFVRTPEKLKAILKEKCTVIESDLSDVNALSSAMENVDTIFHCAANVKTWDSWDNYFKANVAGVDNLTEAILKNRKIKKLIHFSTVDVYGYPSHPCTETDQATGGSYGYGKTKALGEKIIIRKFSTINMPYTIVRPTNVIGPGSQFIEEIGNNLKSGFMFTVNGGKANGGFIYINNLLDYVMWIAESDKANGEIYNLCENNETTWSEFIQVLKADINPQAFILNFPYIPAKYSAIFFEQFTRLVGNKKEPLLHRLFVDMFGKTCNHSAAKIKTVSQIQPKVKFNEAIRISKEWFLRINNNFV